MWSKSKTQNLAKLNFLQNFRESFSKKNLTHWQDNRWDVLMAAFFILAMFFLKFIYCTYYVRTDCTKQSGLISGSGTYIMCLSVPVQGLHVTLIFWFTVFFGYLDWPWPNTVLGGGERLWGHFHKFYLVENFSLYDRKEYHKSNQK